MEKNPNIWILVPDGTGIKNYLYSRVFRDSKSNITLLHNFDTETLSLLMKELPMDGAIELPVYKESINEKFLRELIHLSRLKYNATTENNPTILNAWNRNHKSLKLKVFYFFVVMASYFIKSYQKILSLEAKYDKALLKNPFYHTISAILKKGKPDHLFCTHQRALKAPTIFAAAKALGINTSTVIYSWDNVPKARLALRADAYFVWSHHMKAELIKFYAEISETKIVVTGTPQFEFYYNPENIIPKEKFYTAYQLDPEKKIFCFSGDDIRTSPYDPEYLEHIATAIQKEGLAIQILFRRCPVDVSGRFDAVLNKFPNVIKQAPPLWNFNSKKWTAVYPTKEDIPLLVSTAFYCDAVINVGSTMAFDFGMFQKPCIFINYDVKGAKNWSVDTIYKFQHFRSMPSKNAVYWLNAEEKIAETIQEAIHHPKTAIEDWFKVVVNDPETASENILKELT